jgi:hypothetical protein
MVVYVTFTMALVGNNPVNAPYNLTSHSPRMRRNVDGQCSRLQKDIIAILGISRKAYNSVFNHFQLRFSK